MVTCRTASEGREGRVSSPDTARPPTLSTSRERDKFLAGQKMDKRDIVGQVPSETNSCLDKINSGTSSWKYKGHSGICFYMNKFIAGQDK